MNTTVFNKYFEVIEQNNYNLGHAIDFIIEQTNFNFGLGNLAYLKPKYLGYCTTHKLKKIDSFTNSEAAIKIWKLGPYSSRLCEVY